MRAISALAQTLLLVSLAMARDPFAEELAASGMTSATSSRSSKSSVAMRVVTAVSVLALIGLMVAYHLPLREAHDALTKKYQALSAEAGGTAEQLKKTTEQLLAAQSERDKLVADQKEREETSAAMAEKADGIAKGLEETLSGFIKKKQLSVEKRGDAAYVTIDDDVLFGARDTTVSRGGKRVLCALAKAIEALPAKTTVLVEGHTTGSKVADAHLRRDFPTVWQLSAARAAGATLSLESCGLAGKHLGAVGYAEHRPEEGNGKKSNGEIRVAVRLRPE